jgi:hypothetical protein
MIHNISAANLVVHRVHGDPWGTIIAGKRGHAARDSNPEPADSRTVVSVGCG